MENTVFVVINENRDILAMTNDTSSIEEAKKSLKGIKVITFQEKSKDLNSFIRERIEIVEEFLQEGTLLEEIVKDVIEELHRLERFLLIYG